MIFTLKPKTIRIFAFFAGFCGKEGQLCEGVRPLEDPEEVRRDHELENAHQGMIVLHFS